MDDGHGPQAIHLQGEHFESLWIPIEHGEQTGERKHRDDHQLQSQIDQSLQWVELAKCGSSSRVRRIPENAEKVVVSLSAKICPSGQVLPPLSGGEVPKDGKDDQHQECEGRGTVILHRLGEAEKADGTMNLESRDAKK